MASAQLDLSGMHEFTRVDSATPHALDRPLPEAQQMPVPGQWRNQGIPEQVQVGWVRLRFELPEDMVLAAPAIQLGVLLQADQTFLNGHLIGGEGFIGPPDSGFMNTPPSLPRLYHFDPELLYRDRVNVLDIRLARISFVYDGGVLGPDVRLVDYAAALPGHAERLRRFAAVDYLLLGFEALILLFLAFGYAVGVRDRAFLWFCLLYALTFVASVEQRQVAHFLGVTSPLAEIVGARAGALGLIPLIEFFSCVAVRRVGLFGRALQAATLVFLVPTLTLRQMTGIPFDVFVGSLWPILLVLALGLALVRTVQTIMAGRKGGLTLLVGLLCVVAGGSMDTFLPAGLAEISLGAQGWDFGISALLICLIMVVGRRMQETERALKMANDNVVAAHETERRRVARDLHDGIGQWLTTIKLDLQIFKRGVDHTGLADSTHLDELIHNVNQTIEDTRRVAHNLTPALVDGIGLAGAIQSHLDRLSRDGGIEVSADLEHDLPVPDSDRDHLYRIFQQSLKNALDHANADHLHIALRRRGSAIELSVADNGDGFDHDTAADTHRGFGLTAISERAQLIGADLDIQSEPGSGTTITVSVPLRRPSWKDALSDKGTRG